VSRVYGSKAGRHAEDDRTKSNCKSEAEIDNNNKKNEIALEVLYY